MRSTPVERKARVKKIVAALKKMYPVPKTELRYSTPFQLVVAVMLSAQCTDKLVNRVTHELFKKYKNPKDFAEADPQEFEKAIGSVSFFRTKARHIRATAHILNDKYAGNIPRTEKELTKLPGIAYKTAHVVLGELYGDYEGIPTDTHVKRFAKRFDLVDQEDLTKISKELEALVPKKDWQYVNNGLVLYGRYVCKARPHDCTSHRLTKIWPPALKRWPKTTT